ncbi:MAG TPA: PilZ domain-containing protein [Syntrophaceae bacterium]|nr:PilZ domain-containing protein [Syntrophaceae bacterium]
MMVCFQYSIPEERRRSPRVYTPPIVLYRFSDGYALLGVKRLDISEGGIRLLLPEHPGARVIQLIIYLSDPPICVKGKAVWIKERETEEGRFFETGIEFIQMKSADKVEIAAFIYDTLS